MSNFILSIGLVNRWHSLFRSTIQRLSAHQKYQSSSLPIAGRLDTIDTTDIRARSITPKSISLNHLQARYIYSDEGLGIWKLDRSRERRLELIGNGRERFLARTSAFIDAGDYESIIKEDFINLIALAENEQHLNMVENMAIHYGNETNNFTAEKWGAQVMRLYYKMNQVDRAYNNIKDERFGTFFHQTTTFLIALTMLFKSGRYNDVHEIYEISRDKLSNPIGLRTLSLVMFATYAKDDTQESFEKAMKLFDSLYDIRTRSDNMLTMRVTSLVAFLAGNQGKPAIALDLISRSSRQNHIFLRNIKLLNLFRMERYDDILRMLGTALENVKPDTRLLFKDVHQLVNEKILGLVDCELKNNLTGLMSECEHRELVSMDTLESGIFKEVTGRMPDGHSETDHGYQRHTPRNERNRLRDSNDNGARQTYQKSRRDRDQKRSYFENEDDADDFESNVYRDKKIR